jgi:hypothetical protein
VDYNVKVIFLTREPPLLRQLADDISPEGVEKSPPLIDFLPPWKECPKGEGGV